MYLCFSGLLPKCRLKQKTAQQNWTSDGTGQRLRHLEICDREILYTRIYERKCRRLNM